MDNRYGANRSPLRSPLRPQNQRSGGNSQNRQANQREEEELYNRRRQEELRKQALQQQAHNHFLQPSIRPHSANITPLQQQRASVREQPPPTSHFTLGQQQVGQQPAAPQQLIPLHIREHIAHLQNDNASLMRRLNLVHQELERINKEKGELQSQLTIWMKQSTELYDELNCESHVDKANQYAKDDLIYERERNQKIKEKIQELNNAILLMADQVKQMDRDQELMVRQNQENQFIIEKYIRSYSELEKEQFHNKNRIMDSHHLIEQLRLECTDIDSSKYSIRQTIELIMNERRDTLGTE